MAITVAAVASSTAAWAAPDAPLTGRSAALRGMVCVKHVFVDDAVSAWTPAARQETSRAFAAARAYLDAEARVRDIPLAWREESSSLAIDRDVPEEPSAHRWTEEVIAGYPRSGFEALMVAPCLAVSCDAQLVVIHVAKPGRSYALPGQFNVEERVVMFRRTLSSWSWRDGGFQPSAAQIELVERPAAYVHELLHLFGAEDLYQPEARRLAAERRYPGDVMLQAHVLDMTRSIGPYTEYLIGWSDDRPSPLPE